jgi:hypothetical protein
MIQNTQYTVDHVDQLTLIFTMTSDAHSKSGQGNVAIYGNDFEAPETQDISVICAKNNYSNAN